MKKIYCVFIGLAVSGAYAATPSTSCPSGYTAIKEPYVIIADVCPTGATVLGDADSCLDVSVATICYMYAPANVDYTNEKGTYHFDTACPMEL